MSKVLDLILWGIVALAIVIFVAVIVIGHSTYFNFLSNINLADVEKILNVNIQSILKS